MKYVFLNNGTAVEVVSTDPHLLFVPNYASQFVEVPDDVQAGWRISNGQWHAPDPVYPSKAELIADIDKQADALRLAIVGDPLRVEEYRVAREEAAAFIAAGYTGTVPNSVQSWASAKGWTAKQAADDIATTAQQWSNALYAIRSIRLTGKELIRGAGSDAAAASVHQTVLGQLAALRAQL